MKKRTLIKFFGLAMIVTTISCSSAESEKSTTETKTDSTKMNMHAPTDSAGIDTSHRNEGRIIIPPAVVN